MQRIVFEKIPMEGFRTSKVESIAVCKNGHRLYAGTSDGALIAYDCQTSLSSYSKFNCNIFSTMKSQQKEKKQVSNLTIVEGWGLLIGIIDGVVTAYDLYSESNAVKCVLPDTKGCHIFSIHEYNGIMAVANKRKISVYTWIQSSSSMSSGSSSGFYLRKEVTNLTELPKNVICVTNAIIVGFKRTYEAFDLNNMTPFKILDVDKDQKMLCLELPASDLRSTSILLSHGNQGLLYDLFKIMPNPSTALFNTRLEWASLPLSIHYMTPFLVSLLTDSVEIHDVITLMPLQRLPLPASTSTLSSFASSASLQYCFTSCEIDPSIGLEHGYVSAGDQVFVLRMTPLPAQIMTMLDALRFEDAINLCVLCANNPQLRDIDVAGVHEKYALSLFQRGDFDNAVANYIKADSTPHKVLPLFPDLVPEVFHGYIGISQTSVSKFSSPGSSKGGASTPQSTPQRMTGVVLTRAAAALAHYCEHFRNKRRGQIEIAEKYRAASLNAASALENLETLVGTDWEDELRLLEVVDTVYLCSLLNCSPSRKNAVVDFLSSQSPTNRCHMESSATLLAKHGNAYTEALLWLYRSHNEHKRVLVALTEDRCVGGGAWTRDQFYTWTADYLRWLWFSDDSNLPALVMNALRPVMEYDPELGLSVLTQRPKATFTTAASLASLTSKSLATSAMKGNANIGGKGTEIQEILAYLDTVRLKQNTSTTNASLVNALHAGGGRKGNTSTFPSHLLNADAQSLRIPLVNGRALAIAYLEWRVSNGSVSANMHDEYAQQLMEGVPIDPTYDHNSTDLDIKPTDSEQLIMYKIYRRKLQYFLKTSSEYHPEIVLKNLPSQFLHEYALILSKLGRHEDVLRIYVHQIKDMKLSEEYCDRIYSRHLQEKAGRRSVPNQRQNTPSYIPEEDSVYLILVRVVLSQQTDLEANISIVINLAERFYDRIDTTAFLSVLPENTSMASLAKYLNVVLEYSSTKKRTLQIIHQLLRVQEVHLRTNQS